MFRYIAGNSIKHALKSSQRVIRNSKIPIINFAIEETSDKLKIYTEHKSYRKNGLSSKNSNQIIIL